MIAVQKYVLGVLIRGGAIAWRGSGKFGVKDQNLQLVKNITEQTWRSVKMFTKQGRGGWVISKKAVIGCHGNSWIKQTYI